MFHFVRVCLTAFHPLFPWKQGVFLGYFHMQNISPVGRAALPTPTHCDDCTAKTEAPASHNDIAIKRMVVIRHGRRGQCRPPYGISRSRTASGQVFPQKGDLLQNGGGEG